MSSCLSLQALPLFVFAARMSTSLYHITVTPTCRKPFDILVERPSNEKWLPGLDLTRTCLANLALAALALQLLSLLLFNLRAEIYFLSITATYAAHHVFDADDITLWSTAFREA